MAFGEVLYEEHSSSFVSPYLYNAKELDRDTNLYYYGARYYDPKVSVFLNVDPLAEQTMEPYAYVGNNPVMFVDPTGMASEPPVKGLEYFRDETGEYFWNNSKNKYEHYGYSSDGSTFFKGYYNADKYKEPVGDYSIIFDLSNSKNKDVFDRTLTITEISDGVYSFLNLMGEVNNISDDKYYPGVEIYSSPYMNGALTAGNVIFVSSDMEDSKTLNHEYGHYLDYKFHFKYSKSDYLKTIAFPSFISASSATIAPELHQHEKSESEKRANRLGGAWAGDKYLKNKHRKK